MQPNKIKISKQFCLNQFSVVQNVVLLLADPMVESLNPGRVNKVKRVSKFSSICKSFNAKM